MKDGFAVERKARGAIGHQTFALRATDGLAQIGLARAAELALAAFRRVQRNHMIAHRHRSNTGADFHHDAAAFVAEDGRENAFRVSAGQGIGVGMANASGDDADQHFAGLGRRDIHFDDIQWLTGGPGNSGAGFNHGTTPGSGALRALVGRGNSD